MTKKFDLIQRVKNIVEYNDIYLIYRCPICNKLVKDTIKRSINRILKMMKNNTFIKLDETLACSGKCTNSRVQKLKAIREKIEQTNMKKYGYKTFLETNESNKMQIQAKVKKYGSLSKCSNSAWQNYEKRTGFKHNMHNPKSVKANQEARVKTLKSFSDDRRREWTKRRLETYKKNKSNFFAKNCNLLGCSKQQITFFNMLQKEIAYKIFFGDEEKKFILSDATLVSLDGYIVEKNIAIEYFGNYWHCNPEIYLPNTYVRFFRENILVNKIWEKDQARIDKIKKEITKSTYVVWEKNFLENPYETIHEIKEKIYEE